VNYYSILAFFLVGIIFFYVKLGWLGLIFILLAVLSGFYGHAKKETKSIWKEMDKAEGSFPAGKLTEYTTNAISQTVGVVTQKKEEGLNTREWVSKAPKASKSFFSELKDLFK